MHQRLLLLLSVVLISGAAMAQNVMTPADSIYQYDSTAALGAINNPVPGGNGVMQKWVFDSTQNSDPNRFNAFRTLTQVNFKCYRWGNVSFRLRFPNNYDPTQKYPMVVFLHGAGEAAKTAKNPNGVNHENRDQLYWGAQLFEQRINAGQWNGFLLFPQLVTNPVGQGGEWDSNTIPPVNGILDTLEKYNGLDPNRVIAMGLSAGGLGAMKYADYFPKRIASVIASSPEHVSELNADIQNFLQIPLWMASGGIDTGPNPGTAMSAVDNMSKFGGNVYYSYFSTQGHGIWNLQWYQLDFYNKYILISYWNTANKAQPLLYFNNNQFCEGQPISAKMGITAGFAAYEWQYDNGGGFTTIPGATSNIYTATQAGKYQVHFKRAVDSPWSAWTPNPIVISTKKCSSDTAYAEHFEETPIYYVALTGDGTYNNSAYYYQNTGCQNGLFPNATENFTQDALGRQGGKFMFNATVDTCKYKVNDQVWHNNANVTPYTDYTFNFYMGNQKNYYNGNSTAPPAYLKAAINGTTITPAAGVKAVSIGNFSWKKYSYTWNSGASSNANIAIINNTLDPTWNDFVLDEISLVKYKTPFMPGAGVKNVDLWTKANSINGFNGSNVGLWSNDDINGNSLIQPAANRQPIYKNNAADNINFNPVVTFTQANNKILQIDTGFSGSAIHNAVHTYIVAKINNLTQNKNILYEGQSGSGMVKIAIGNPGKISWTAGLDPDNTVSTPNNTIEAGKPTVWTFSKDNANTPSGNKQDIRKNGIVVASNNNIASFTGNNSPFTLGTVNLATGTFDANIAEVIYLLDSTLTPLAQNKIESYLALKYGTTQGNTANPISYTASDGTTIFWPATASFQNDVFGIGKDSASGLVQAKSNSVNSGSGDGTGQSAKGNLVLASNTELMDRQFLMVGNDAGSLSQHIIASGEANPVIVGSTRITRNWKAYNTGNIGAVDLSFDTTGLGVQAGADAINNYALMIDTDGDGDYNTGTLSFFNATGTTGKKLNFSGLALNNGVVFTVITFKFNSALPAVWLGFTAEAVNGNGVLNWKTGDEINVDHYTVEHSFTGISFTPIASVAARNNSGENKYAFTHTGLAPGVHYYRIRRTDKNGKTSYSDIKSIKITTTGANVQVRPNPVIGSTLVLAVSVQLSNKTDIQVMGVDGKVILHQTVNLVGGNNLVSLNIASVPPGVYLVQVQLSDEVVTKKFIKER